jgi:hypothetical protein
VGAGWLARRLRDLQNSFDSSFTLNGHLEHVRRAGVKGGVGGLIAVDAVA